MVGYGRVRSVTVVWFCVMGETHHMCPLGACRETWLLYWKAGCSLDNTGSCGTNTHKAITHSAFNIATPIATTGWKRTVQTQ